MTASEEIVCLTDNDDDCILESVTYNSKHEHIEICYDSIFRENPLFVNVIERCFELESSQGMSMVINGTLLRVYKEADESYKMSTEFEMVLRKTLIVLESNPEYRFSHIKNLCEILRSKKFKKRVQLITLGINIGGNNVTRLSLKRKSSMEKNSKIQKTDIIDLDKIEDLPIINLNDSENLDNSQNDVVMISERCTVIDEKENDSTKENNGYVEPNGDKLLVPQKMLELPSLDLNKVQDIEMQIKKYKEIIAKLDVQEVTVDNDSSPYLESERLKGKIVSLYKELCKLTGAKECKRREVRLKVIEGHPPGPVRNLERFLNSNFGSDGSLPFPDFCDVVNCVEMANKNDNLGWTKHQIMSEATALFTHCGRALQKRRQKRDWRYILSRVKTEEFDDDPAENDPVLQARLEANKRAALKKENELLERYTMMQYLPPQRKVAKNGNIPATCHMEVSDNNSESLNHSDNKIITEVEIPNDLVPNIEPDIPIKDNYPTSNKSVHMKSPLHEEIINIAGTIRNEVDIKLKSDVVKVKTEPTEDVMKLLEAFGDNYTVSVVDLNDPFFVIEISDSSDEE